MIRVALAEDKGYLAKAIREKLALFGKEVVFVFHAENGREMLAGLADNHAVDVILMDIEMPEMDGIACTAAIAEQYPQIKILMLTVFDDEQRIFDAIKAGAMGYLLKDEPPHKIREALTIIMEGGAPMSPGIAAKSLKLLRDPGRVMAPQQEAEFNLSKREVDVLEQLSEGLDYQEIAENLFISPATVRKHIENIYRKLQVNNKMKAVRKATRHKII